MSTTIKAKVLVFIAQVTSEGSDTLPTGSTALSATSLDP